MERHWDRMVLAMNMYPLRTFRQPYQVLTVAIKTVIKKKMISTLWRHLWDVLQEIPCDQHDLKVLLVHMNQSTEL